ncbi:MAG: hypothetical protein H7Z14_04430 [Anaerolineae bacterium]|nr:hypothetical protein [Phycisphaerae bacterium]
MSESTVSSPPPTERPIAPPVPEARDRLIQLAGALASSRDVHLLREYLRLRSAIRAA